MFSSGLSQFAHQVQIFGKFDLLGALFLSWLTIASQRKIKIFYQFILLQAYMNYIIHITSKIDKNFLMGPHHVVFRKYRFTTGDLRLTVI